MAEFADLLKTNAGLEEARTLTRDVRTMQLELDALRNARPEGQRMTVAEAEAELDAQVTELAAVEARTSQTAARVAAARKRLAEMNTEMDALRTQRAAAEKQEAEVRKAEAAADEQVAASHRWCVIQ